MSGSFLFLLRMTCAHASRRDNALSDLINSAHEIIISYHALRSTDKIINFGDNLEQTMRQHLVKKTSKLKYKQF